jgi:hypothetical protein
LSDHSFDRPQWITIQNVGFWPEAVVQKIEIHIQRTTASERIAELRLLALPIAASGQERKLKNYLLLTLTSIIVVLRNKSLDCW